MEIGFFLDNISVPFSATKNWFSLARSQIFSSIILDSAITLCCWNLFSNLFFWALLFFSFPGRRQRRRTLPEKERGLDSQEKESRVANLKLKDKLTFCVMLIHFCMYECVFACVCMFVCLCVCVCMFVCKLYLFVAGNCCWGFQSSPELTFLFFFSLCSTKEGKQPDVPSKCSWQLQGMLRRELEGAHTRLPAKPFSVERSRCLWLRLGPLPAMLCWRGIAEPTRMDCTSNRKQEVLILERSGLPGTFTCNTQIQFTKKQTHTNTQTHKHTYTLMQIHTHSYKQTNKTQNHTHKKVQVFSVRLVFT